MSLCDVMTAETATVKLSTNGRILIPLALRRALGVKPGDKLVLEAEDGTMRVSTRETQLREVQAIARKFLAGKPSLVDELIAERRAEAARE
jgi:AbrB family looped-hinge helix DNA binding protein